MNKSLLLAIYLDHKTLYIVLVLISFEFLSEPEVIFTGTFITFNDALHE